MAQDGTTAGGASYTIDNVTFPVGRTKLQSIFNAIRTNNKGASAPDLVAGQFWIDDSTDPTWTLYLYDGSDSIQFATINTTDNSVNFIDSTFTQLTSDLATNGNDINFGDNDKAVFGAGNDLEIYSDGTNSRITESGSGSLIIRGTQLILQSPAGENLAYFFTDGEAQLYHNGVQKLATKSTGIDVTGTVVSDGLQVDATTDGSGVTVGLVSGQNVEVSLDRWSGSGSNFHQWQLYTDVADLQIGNVYNNTKGTAFTPRVDFALNGDISFYEDTGTTPKFFWDASAESLGIGTSSPASKLEVEDSVNGDMHLRINNTNTGSSARTLLLLQSDGATGSLYLNGANRVSSGVDEADSMTLTSDASASNGLNINATSGSIKFYYNYLEKMRIASNGRVGIGTSSPERLLHLQSSAPEIMMKDSDDSSYNTILSNGGTLSITTSAGTLNVEPLGAGAVQLASPTSLGFNIGSGYNYEFDVNGTEAMRIDNNRNVGIGTNSPSSFSSGAYNLVISQPSGSNAGITINNDGANTGSIFFANGTSETAKGRIRYDHSDDHLEISTVDTERMRIDSSGNVFMAKTTDTITTVGHYFGSNGAVNHVRDGVNVMSLGRKSSDGDILSFYKDSTKVGSIGSSAGNYLTIGNNVNTRLRFTASDIRPCDSSGADRDNAIDLGDGVVGARFKDFYLAGNIYLGGTGSANALDDYEEGTWTPTYIGSTTNPSVTYDTTVRYGEYTKIGRKVFITCVVRTDAVASTGSGELRVGGLPFTSSNEFSSATRYGFVVAGATSFNSTPVDLVAYTDVSQNYIRLNEDYGGTSFDTSELKNGANFNSIRISGFYVTTA